MSSRDEIEPGFEYYCQKAMEIIDSDEYYYEIRNSKSDKIVAEVRLQLLIYFNKLPSYDRDAIAAIERDDMQGAIKLWSTIMDAESVVFYGQEWCAEVRCEGLISIAARQVLTNLLQEH